MDDLENKVVQNPLFLINKWIANYKDDHLLDGLLATIIQLIILSLSTAIYEDADTKKKNGEQKYSSHDAMACAITQLRALADRLQVRLSQEQSPEQVH